MLDALKSQIRNYPSLSWAFFVSAALLALFCGLQVAGSSILTLPVQWIWISVLPILVALITGGYIRKMEFLGQKVETWRPGTKYVGPPGAHLETSGVTPVAEAGSESLKAERDKEYERVGKRVDGKELDGRTSTSHQHFVGSDSTLRSFLCVTATATPILPINKDFQTSNTPSLILAHLGGINLFWRPTREVLSASVLQRGEHS